MVWKPDKSARGPITHVEEPIRDRLTMPLFTYCILLHSWTHTHKHTQTHTHTHTHTHQRLPPVSCCCWNINWLNSSDEVFSIIFWASDGKLLKNKIIQYIKTAQINLREWQKLQQLLILYINIGTLWCYSWENWMYSNNYQALNSAGNC